VYKDGQFRFIVGRVILKMGSIREVKLENDIITTNDNV